MECSQSDQLRRLITSDSLKVDDSAFPGHAFCETTPYKEPVAGSKRIRLGRSGRSDDHKKCGDKRECPHRAA
jgi:hypothetical protein